MSKARPYFDELTTVTGAARESGIARTTLIHAIHAEALKAFRTTDGTPLVRMSDVEAYANNRPQKGPRKR